MPSETIITIQLKPYLIDWLKSKYGDYPIVATKKNAVGILIKHFLKKTPLDYAPCKQNDSSCEIILPYDLHIDVRGSVYVPDYENSILEKTIEEMFNSIYFSFIDSNYVPRTERESLFQNGVKDLTEKFMRIHQLNPDHISHDTLIKRFQRHKKATQPDE